MTAKHCLNVAVDADTKDLLARLAKLQNTTTSELIRRAISGYLTELKHQLQRQLVAEETAKLEAFAGVRVQKYNLRPSAAEESAL
jgi:ribosomal protein S17E